MKKVLIAAAALVVAGSFLSIVGIIADADRLTFWTQALMWSLLGTVLVVPALVFAGSSAVTDDTPPTPSSGTGRSLLRTAAYVFSGTAFVWTAISFVSLFVYPEHLEFWTQSVLWSLLVLLVWAPVMTFFINPFEDPALSQTVNRSVHDSESHVPAAPASAPSSGVLDKDVQDFVPQHVVNVQPRTIPPKEDADINTNVFDEDEPSSSSSVDWPDDPAS